MAETRATTEKYRLSRSCVIRPVDVAHSSPVAGGANRTPCSLPWALGLFFLACGLASCADTKSDPVQPVSTPKADLELAMARLQRALDLSRPSRRSGLRIKRDMRYEYLAPDSPEANHTAVVSIDTLAIYLPNRPAAKEPTDPTDASQSNVTLDSLLLDSAGTDPFSDPDAGYFAVAQHDAAGKQWKRPVADARVPDLRQEESQDFHLVHRQGKWQLENEPEVPHERLWFNYALGN